MSTMKDTALLLALKEEVAAAIKANNLEEKMDIFRLKAADIDANLDELIQEAKKANQEAASLMQIISPKKKIISLISVGIIVLEWIFAFSIAGKLSFWGLLLLLIINLVSALAIVFGFAIAIKFKK